MFIPGNLNLLWKNFKIIGDNMQNYENEILSVLPVRNNDGCYLQKTYSELIKEISPEEIDDLYSFFEQFEEKNNQKNNK